jgi:hypothetical protein
MSQKTQGNNMHVCKATVKDYEKKKIKYFKNPELFPDF